MKIYHSIPSDLPPTALTIGTFDGFHLGHRALFKRLLEVSSHTTVLTFSNHPLEVLKPKEAPTLITPLHRKLSFLEELGIDVAIAIPFTQELANLSYETFLNLFPLTHLILGAGATLGKNREGTPDKLLSFSKKQRFLVEYVDKILIDGEPISSSRIRRSLIAGNFEQVSRLLGRPFNQYQAISAIS